jgi:hypothetical protein
MPNVSCPLSLLSLSRIKTSRRPCIFFTPYLQPQIKFKENLYILGLFSYKS